MSRSGRYILTLSAALTGAAALLAPSSAAAAVFTMRTSTPGIVVAAGGSAPVVLTFTPRRPSGLAFSFPGLPAGVSTRSACGTRSCTVTVSAAADAASFNGAFSVSARSGRTRRSVAIALQVQGAPVAPPTTKVLTTAPPTTNAGPQPITLRPAFLIATTPHTGGNVAFPLTVVRNGWMGPVSLLVTSMPTGWRAGFLPANPIINENTTLLLTMPDGTAEGDYTIAIAAKSANDTQVATLVVRVRPPRVAVSVLSAPSGVAGSNVSFTVDARSMDDVSLPVTLSITGLPMSVLAYITPNPVAGQATVTFTIPPTMAAGAYPFVVTATRGALAASANATLTVTRTAAAYFNPTAVAAVAGDAVSYGLTAAPAGIAIARGGSAFFDVTVTPKGGFVAPIAITYSAATGGSATYSYVGPNVFRVTVTAPSNAATGSYITSLQTFSGTLAVNLSVLVTVS